MGIAASPFAIYNKAAANLRFTVETFLSRFSGLRKAEPKPSQDA
jgi:hypothetical protein